MTSPKMRKRPLRSMRVANFGPVARSMGSAHSFEMLGSSTVTNTGSLVITGDLGVTPGTAVTVFPSSIGSWGSILAVDAQEKQARADATAA
jgi:Ice-binding-like